MLGNINARKRRRGWQRMRWLDSITDSVDMNLSRHSEIVKDRGAWCAAVHGVTINWTWLKGLSMHAHSSTSSQPFVVMLILIIINYKKTTLMHFLNTIVSLVFIRCMLVLLCHYISVSQNAYAETLATRDSVRKMVPGWATLENTVHNTSSPWQSQLMILRKLQEGSKKPNTLCEF